MTIAAGLFLLVPGRASASDRDIIEGFRQMYFISGIPVDGRTIDRNSADVSFQISLALPLFRDIAGHEGLDVKIGYTQKSVWMLYAQSHPFKGNMYIPGLYLDIPMKDAESSLLCGLEHRSNGLGDSMSRSINYIFGEYEKKFPFGLTVSANARFGFGWYDETLTQDIFSGFMGYATIGALYETGRFGALISLTPVFGPFRMNTTAELSYRLGKGKDSIYHLFLQYHNGYDECMSDCVYGIPPVQNLRFGILITPRGCSRLSR